MALLRLGVSTALNRPWVIKTNAQMQWTPRYVLPSTFFVNYERGHCDPGHKTSPKFRITTDAIYTPRWSSFLGFGGRSTHVTTWVLCGNSSLEEGQYGYTYHARSHPASMTNLGSPPCHRSMATKREDEDLYQGRRGFNTSCYLAQLLSC